MTVSSLDEFFQKLAEQGRQFPHPAVALGTFDGVHLGHQALIGHLSDLSRGRNVPSLILTFDRHPLCLVRPEKAPPALQTLEEKCRLLNSLGVDGVVVMPFTSSFAGLDAGTFIRKVLVDSLAISAAVFGECFRFGRGGHGDQKALEKAGQEAGFTVHPFPKFSIGGVVASSTHIRRLLGAGKVEEAGRFLGRPYSLSGTVAPGRRLGRTIGRPTANLVPDLALILAKGVYAGHLQVDARRHPAVINVGTRPTVETGPEGALLLEAHLPGFQGDLYGQRVVIETCRRLRNELRFDSVSALASQIERDVETALAFLQEKP